jgi:hypothetical protein
LAWDGVVHVPEHAKIAISSNAGIMPVLQRIISHLCRKVFDGLPVLPADGVASLPLTL